MSCFVRMDDGINACEWVLVLDVGAVVTTHIASVRQTLEVAPPR